MEKEKRGRPARQKIVENYEQQKAILLKQGYREKAEIISVVRANVMVAVTSLPLCIAGLFVWKVFGRGDWRTQGWDTVFIWLLFLLSIIVHEALHGAAWCIGAKEGWKSIYMGMMWEALTPYCHCKKPLSPGTYLFGCLFPGMVLGIGIYAAAFITGSAVLLWLSILNILGAGGDIWVAWRVRKYHTGYVLDHPTECGFVLFQKQDPDNA